MYMNVQFHFWACWKSGPSCRTLLMKDTCIKPWSRDYVCVCSYCTAKCGFLNITNCARQWKDLEHNNPSLTTASPMTDLSTGTFHSYVICFIYQQFLIHVHVLIIGFSTHLYICLWHGSNEICNQFYRFNIATAISYVSCDFCISWRNRQVS
jgi:hypothetical protein